MKKVYIIAEVDSTGKAVSIKVGTESVTGSVEHRETVRRYRSERAAQEAVDNIDALAEVLLKAKV